MDDTSKKVASERPFVKHTGIGHFFAALRFSCQGLCRLSKETAFAHEAIALVAGEIALIALGAPVHHWLIFIGLMVFVIAFEALNTSIEEVVDRVSPEFSLVAKNAKDLGSLSVACVMAVAGGFFVYSVVMALFFA